MKTIINIQLVILIIVAFFPVQTRAHPSILATTESRQKLLEYGKDISTISKSIASVSDMPDIIMIQDNVTYCAELIDHLNDLTIILTIIHNDAERKQVRAILNKHTAYMSKMIDLSISQMNVSISSLHNLAVISICNEIKAELRKVKEMLKQ